MKKELIASSVFRFLERGIVVVTSLLLTPFLIGELGEHDYGLWILIISVLGWFNIINLGFPSAVQRHITLALENADHQKVNVVFSTSLLLFGALGVFAAAGIITLALFPSIFGVAALDQSTLALALSIFSLKVLWDFLMNAIHGFFAGLLRYDIDANISSFNAIIKALLVYLLVTDLNIMGAIIATLAADLISNVLKVIYARKIYPRLSFGIKNASWQEVNELFAFSKHVIAAGIAKSINTKADPILVTKLFDLSSVAMYSIAVRLTSHVQAFVSSVTGIFAPVFTKMAAKNIDMEQMFNRTVSINFFVATTLFLPLLIFGGLFIRLWVGDGFIDSIVLLGFLAFSFICLSISEAVKNILFAQAKHKLITVINLLGAVFNIVLSVILAQKWGLLGVAAGTAIGFFISDIILNLILLKRYNNYQVWPVIKTFITAVILVFVVGLSGQYFVTHYLSVSWLTLIISAALSLPIIVILNWTLLLDREMKQKTRELLVNKFKNKMTY